MAFLTRRRQEAIRSEPQIRALTASAQRIQNSDRNEARRLLQARQAWQLEAWAYRRSLGELRYASAYLGNSIARLRLHPATYIEGESEPVELTDEVATRQGIPLDLVDAANDVMNRLGAGGPLAIQAIQRKLTENFEIAGECYLVGTVDPLTRVENWNIRSVSELEITRDGKYGVKETPAGGGVGGRDIQWLDPDNSFVTRLWWPDPEFSYQADSPVRAILDICEELLLLGRDVRATARSRLANNGVLFLPDSLSVVNSAPGGVQQNAAIDPFMAQFIQAASAALQNEGAAEAILPIMARGPAEAIAAVKHLQLQRPANVQNIAQRQELIGRMATGIDLPAEVLSGKADLNHWTSWQIDDDSFRHHVEPIAIVEADALTAGYLWLSLDEMNNAGATRWDPEVVRRVIVWYDPTALVTHPDRSADASNAVDRGAIGRHAYRSYLGMPEADKPDELDEVLYILKNARGVDPGLLASILRTVAKTIHIPDPGSVPAASPAVSGGPDEPDPSEPTPTDGPPPGGPPTGGPPPTGEPAASDSSAGDFRALVAAAQSQREAERLSRSLLDIDRSVRDRLTTASNTAVKRALERAGAKVVSKARTASAASLREQIRGVPQWQVPYVTWTLGGRSLIAALGLDEHTLLDTAFDELSSQFDKWVSDAQRQSAQTAAKLVGRDPSEAVDRTHDRMDRDRAEAWKLLQSSLRTRAQQLLTTPADADGGDDGGGDNGVTDRLVPTGFIRSALAVAGGFVSKAASSGINPAGRPVDPSEVMGQIGTGATIGEYLTGNGATHAGYQWVHGVSDRPFEPHLDLDGTEFQNFDDDVLAVQGDFPDTGHYHPGDHDGCSCDFVQLWQASASAADDAAEAA